jgi:hypothetical protein
MVNLSIICPVTGKTFKAAVVFDQVVILSARHEPVAVWCSHCERSHYVSSKGLLTGTVEQEHADLGNLYRFQS